MVPPIMFANLSWNVPIPNFGSHDAFRLKDSAFSNPHLFVVMDVSWHVKPLNCVVCTGCQYLLG